MLYSLRGTVIHRDPAGFAVECGGIAFYCLSTLSTLSNIGSAGTEVMVHTHMHFQQDAVSLYGFGGREELACFRMLIGVSGVGPKAALNILSVMNPEQLALCVASEDYKAITRAQGVGPKLAKRIVLELRDKVGASDLSGGLSDTQAAVLGFGAGSAGEAVSALTALGYGRSDAAAVVAGLDADLPVEEMIKAGLKVLAGKL